MKILFVCKKNIFRSKIAEAYFNKINKNKSIRAISAGVNSKGTPLYKNEKEILRTFGIKFNTKFNKVTPSLLDKQDKIIVVANDVPLRYFEGDNREIEVWRISDAKANTPKTNIKRIVSAIIKKVDKLNRSLINEVEK